MPKYNNAHELNDAFKDLSVEARSKIFDEIKAELPDLIHSALAMNKVFKYLLPEERAEVFETIRDRVPDFIKNKEQHDNVCEFITVEMQDALKTAIMPELKPLLTSILDHSMKSVSIDKKKHGTQKVIIDQAAMNYHSMVITRVNDPAPWSLLQLGVLRNELHASLTAMRSREVLAVQELIRSYKGGHASGFFGGKVTIANRLEKALSEMPLPNRANVISSSAPNEVQAILREVGQLDKLREAYVVGGEKGGMYDLSSIVTRGPRS